MPKNLPLFEDIILSIEADPSHLNMWEWEGWCGTTHCIAGWAMVKHHNVDRLEDLPDIEDMVEAGSEALGIDYHEGDRLFQLRNWPHEFAKPYRTTPSKVERGQIAINRIRHFLATGE